MNTMLYVRIYPTYIAILRRGECYKIIILKLLGLIYICTLALIKINQKSDVFANVWYSSSRFGILRAATKRKRDEIDRPVILREFERQKTRIVFPSDSFCIRYL